MKLIREEYRLYVFSFVTSEKALENKKYKRDGPINFRGCGCYEYVCEDVNINGWERVTYVKLLMTYRYGDLFSLLKPPCSKLVGA